MYKLCCFTILTVIILTNATEDTTGPSIMDKQCSCSRGSLDCIFRSTTFSLTLYTRTNPSPTPLTPENVQILDVNLPTKLILHGYCSHGEASWISLMRDTYLNRQDYNIIVVDWSRYARGLYYSIRDTENLEMVAHKIAEVLNAAVESGNMGFGNMHFVGHSLGAHLAGHVARILSRAHTQKVYRVTSLDAAGVNFDASDILRILHPDYIDFVDAIHTSSLGCSAPIGHADYYANDGTSQPGCSDIVSATCSHGRSYEMWTESINAPESDGFVGRKCDSLMAFEDGECNGEEVAVMGENAPRSAAGKYFLRTNDKYPLAKGSEGSLPEAN